jgi:hypothetical protein
MSDDLQAPPAADDVLLNITEAAKILRTPIATMRYWRHLGVGPASFKIGRRIFYWRSEIHRWLREQAAVAASALAQD